MGTLYKILIATLLVFCVVFARSGENNLRVAKKSVKNSHYIIKDQLDENQNKPLDRKRVHKRRRKIRKPIKGLR